MSSAGVHHLLPHQHARTLLLDATSFPTGWEVIPCEPYCARQERSYQSGRSFIHSGRAGHVLQDVHVLQDAAGAQAMFERYQSVEFQRLPPPAVTFQAPSANSYRSQLADAWDFRCGVNLVPACKAFYAV